MLVYISGWPACGATFYGEWLARHFAFQHLDLDHPLALPATLRALWKQLDVGNAPALAAHLGKLHPRWVFTGSPPTDDLTRLDALGAAGFSLWFLLARTESLSRQRWLMQEREIDPAAKPLEWERTADAIRSNARRLRPYFREHCIETLNTGLVLMEGDELAARIGVTAAKPAPALDSPSRESSA